jgi:phosphohistidine phosphatase
VKTLLLLRHAKSSWADSGLSDHDRPLNKRGKRDAPRMARLIVDAGWVPDLILSSSATRARDTALIVAEACDWSPEVRLQRGLYLSEPGDYLEQLKHVPPQAARVLLVGHNPGMEALGEKLTGVPVHMPTAALLVLETSAPFSELGEHGANIVGNYRPKELDG